MEMARQLANIAGAPYGIKPKMIAKIERAEAIPALQSILDASDGIMVARGDLAVEVGNARAGAAEADDPDGARVEQARDHRDADDGIDDPRAGADAPKCRTSRTRCSTAPTR
jgi:hypothetical protein